MLASLLTFSIFILSGIIGYATFTLIYGRRRLFRNLLLSPFLGTVVILLPTLQLSRLGMPVHSFAAPLLLVLCLGATAVFVIRRPAVPWRALAVFSAVALLAFVLTDRPLFEFGFNWLSFSNDDLANYTNAAERFMRAGYFQLPPHASMTDLLSSVDIAYWHLYAMAGERAGSELLLAFLISLTGLKAVQAFMPLIAAGHLMLVWAVAGLVARSPRRLIVPAAVGIGVAMSAPTALGVLYQLIAQVYGLAALAFAVIAFQDRAFCFAPLNRSSIGPIVCATLALTALMVYYPEVLPMLIASTGLSVLVVALRRKLKPLRLAVRLAATGLATAVVLNFHLITMIELVRARAKQALTSSSGQTDAPVFPYFLVPSGIANLWGLVPVAVFPQDPWMSIAILSGMVLSIVVLVAIVIAVWRRTPAGMTAAAMLVAGAMLAYRRADFGLFKLAMYCQPFVLACIAEAAGALRRRDLAGSRRLQRGAVAAVLTFTIGAMGLGTQWFYVEVSRDLPGAPAHGFVEIPHASSDRILDQLDQLSRVPTNGIVVMDAANISLVKIEAAYERGHPMLLLTGDALYNLMNSKAVQPPFRTNVYAQRVRADKQIETRFKRFSPYRILGLDMNGTRKRLYFRAPHLHDATTWDMTSTARQTVLNRSTNLVRDRDLILLPSVTMPNHLRFISTSEMTDKGLHEFSSFTGQAIDRSRISLYQLEPDYFYPNESMSAFGRDFVFEVSHPSKSIHLILSVTASIIGDGQNRVPPAKAVATKVVPFPAVGRGAARLVSPAITPVKLAGDSYVAIDMGRDGKRLPYARLGLMHLYGRNVPMDPRKVVVFGRDISAISDQEYRKWKPPSLLKNISSDLLNPQLEYSGFYEDSWLSDDVYVKLNGGGSRRYLAFNGYVPGIDDLKFSTTCTISVDGRLLATTRLSVGEFAIKRLVRLVKGEHSIFLHFTRSQVLRLPDTRKVTVHVNRLGFTS